MLSTAKTFTSEKEINEDTPSMRVILVMQLSFALLIHGIVRVVIGGFAKVLPNWLQGLLVVIGLLTIALSVVVFISPESGFLTLIFLLSIGFLLNGMARIASGITGIR